MFIPYKVHTRVRTEELKRVQQKAEQIDQFDQGLESAPLSKILQFIHAIHSSVFHGFEATHNIDEREDKIQT